MHTLSQAQKMVAPFPLFFRRCMHTYMHTYNIVYTFCVFAAACIALSGTDLPELHVLISCQQFVGNCNDICCFHCIPHAQPICTSVPAAHLQQQTASLSLLALFVVHCCCCLLLSLVPVQDGTTHLCELWGCCRPCVLLGFSRRDYGASNSSTSVCCLLNSNPSRGQVYSHGLK